MIMYCRELAKAVKARVTLKNWNSAENYINLSVISVGEDPASQSYIKSKEKACSECGFDFTHYELYDGVEEKEVLDLINRLNNDEKVTGILVQLPLPKHLDAMKITEAINPIKDVDGFHPINIGKLSQGIADLVPCTPSGVLEILKDIFPSLDGLKVCIIGRSNIVGKPLAMLLLNENATVTVCHSKTVGLKKELYDADVVVSAVGIPNFIDTKDLGHNTIVIDVGINRLENGSLCGDVKVRPDFGGIATAVPGGVGLMTVAKLMENLYTAYELQNR